MYRLLVGALAAFVGFSFGNAVPKWIENRGQEAAPAAQNHLVDLQQQMPARKNVLRRKPFRRFKFTSSRVGREEAKLTRAEMVVDGKLGDAKDAGSQPEKESVSLIGGPGSTSDTEDDTTGGAALSCWKPRAKVAKKAHIDKIEAPLLTQNASAPAIAKGSLKLQIQEWKSKLRRLKSKAVANEKLWCDKYEKTALEQQSMGEIVPNEAPATRVWEHEPLKKLPQHAEEKPRRVLQEGSKKLSSLAGKEFGRKVPECKELTGILQGKNKPESSILNASVARNQRRDFTFLKSRRKGDQSRPSLGHALVEGRRADLER